MRKIVQTPRPPYYAVIFTSLRKEGDHGYAEMSRRVLKELQGQPGFLGYEGARQDIGVTVSYWESLAAIRAWKENPVHREAQQAYDDWYADSRIRVCKVERDDS